MAMVVVGIFILGIATGYLFNQSQQTRKGDMYSLLQDTQNIKTMHELVNKYPEIKKQLADIVVSSTEEKQRTNNKQSVQDIIQTMKSDHDFMMSMMMNMINDPELRLHMIGHMTENNETMQMMSQLVKTPYKEIIDKDTMIHITKDPEKRKEMIRIMTEFDQELANIQSQQLDEEEYIQVTNSVIQKHISKMQELADKIQRQHSDAH